MIISSTICGEKGHNKLSCIRKIKEPSTQETSTEVISKQLILKFKIKFQVMKFSLHLNLKWGKKARNIRKHHN